MKLVLKAARLIDGTGADPISNAALVIENGRITEVTTQEALRTAAGEEVDVIEAPGGSIMPGFIEMHTHMHISAEPDAQRHIMTDSHEVLLLRAAKAVRAELSSGVTTMRDLGAQNGIAFPIKQAIEDGIIPGPRLLASGMPITTTGGHGYFLSIEADTTEEVVQAVRHQRKVGADCIKIMATGGGLTPGTNMRAAQYSEETLRAAVEDAERLGLRVSAHCHGTPGIRNAVHAGIHCVAHCTWLAEDPSEMFDYDPRVADLMVEKGLYVDPTLALGYLAQLRSPERWASLMRRMDPERRFEILRDMWDRGVKFVTGLDAGVPNARFDDFAYIPQVMVEKLEISPMEAIVCSTRTSAECLGILEETGTLEVGKAADAVIVKGDPTADIRAMHDVDSIVRQGDVVKRNGTLLF